MSYSINAYSNNLSVLHVSSLNPVPEIVRRLLTEFSVSGEIEEITGLKLVLYTK